VLGPAWQEVLQEEQVAAAGVVVALVVGTQQHLAGEKYAVEDPAHLEAGSIQAMEGSSTRCEDNHMVVDRETVVQALVKTRAEMRDQQRATEY
jgi:hypothetical protein